MPAEMQDVMQAGSLHRVLDEIWHNFRSSGWQHPQSAAVVVAQMFAVANAPPTLLAAQALFDDQSELTAGVWAAITRDLVQADPRLQDAAASADAYERNLPPGILERVRRRLLEEGLLQRGIAAPWSWLRAVFDLAYSRQPEFPTLSHEACILVDACVGVRPGDRVYCAFAGSAEIGLFLAAERRVQVDIEVRERDLASMLAWLAAAGGLALHARVADPLEGLAQDGLPRKTAFGNTAHDVAIVHGPFGERRDRQHIENLWRNVGLFPSGNLESLYVLLAATRARRTAVCITLNGFLFRTTGAEQAFKEKAIRQHGMDAVVTLPRGAFVRHSNLPGSLLLFRSGPERLAAEPSRDVLMVDSRRDADHGDEAAWAARVAQLVHTRAESDTSILVPLQEMVSHDFNLTVDRYVLSTDARRARDRLAASIPLDDIVELYRPQALLLGRDRGSVSVTQAFPDEAVTLLEVGVADIDEAGIVRRPAKQVPATQEVIQRARRATLEAGDILLVIKGSVGKVGFVRETPQGETWLASQSFVVLKLRRHSPISDPLVLFRFLSSTLGKETILSLKGGMIPSLQMNDVRRLPILIPPQGTHASIIRQVNDLFEIQDRIIELHEEFARLQSAVWPDHAENGVVAAGC